MRFGVTCTCVDCGHTFATKEHVYLCPQCGDPSPPIRGVLYLRYPKLPEDLEMHEFFASEWLELLPVLKADSFPAMRVGRTPLYRRVVDGREVWLKDDSQNPTWSYKDRASVVVSAHARECGAKTIVAASTGNAGSSIAGICAAQGQRAVVIVPEAAPEAKLLQAMAYGAKVIRVKGDYDAAFELSLRATEAFGWYNRNTAYNPVTIEGKKTAAFEIAQMHPRVDRVFIPAGDGVIAAGVWKGFIELFENGLTRNIPQIVLVQATGSANLVRNLTTDNPTFPAAHTLADSIQVTVPRNLGMIRYLAEQYDHDAIVVSDDEIVDAERHLARTQGILVEPAAAAAWAGWRKSRPAEGLVDIVLLTGSGLKDLAPLRETLHAPAPIAPELSALRTAMGDNK